MKKNVEKFYTEVFRLLSEAIPEPETELHYNSPYELLVAVMLSAQCTDKRVNMTTPALFERFPDPQALAEATAEDIYPYIKSISYPNNKAKNLAKMAQMLAGEFGGVVPDSVEELERLPGVGHKTANVVASVIYNRLVMPVDTHVHRVSRRIGLTVGARNVRQTEEQLCKYLPAEQLPTAHHLLILHGRYTCTARSPKCEACALAGICKKNL